MQYNSMQCNAIQWVELYVIRSTYRNSAFNVKHSRHVQSISWEMSEDEKKEENKKMKIKIEKKLKYKRSRNEVEM